MKLIYYKNNDELESINNIISKSNKNDIYIFKLEIWRIHALFTQINPPFFDEIIVLRNDLTDNDFEQLFNMLKVGSNLIYLNTYNLNNFKNIFKNYKNNNKFSMVTKNINYVYNFYGTKWRFPVDFIIMGAPKSATTALAYTISKHPDLYIDGNKDPTISEPHFFDLFWKKGIEWYKKKFNYKKIVVGEKTPNLLYLEFTFPLIQMVNPYVKIILILRDPIHRAYSEYKMKRIMYPNEHNKTFEEEINLELERINKYKNKTFHSINVDYLDRGLYYKYIKILMRWFSKDNIIVLLTTDFEKNPTVECNKIYKFLNVKELKIIEQERIFESKDKSTIDIKLYKKLIPFFKKDTEKLEKLLNIKTNWFTSYI